MTYTEMALIITATVPLLNLLIIIVTISVLGFCFRQKITALVDTIANRIKAGGKFNAWGLEFEELQEFEEATPIPTDSETPPADFNNITELNSFRYSYYEKSRKLFLVHVIKPSKHDGQQYDIFIYLYRHKSNDFSDISQADFFLGPYWGNQIFTRKVKNSKIGLSTSAFGSFLCICKVSFTDGSEVILDRYIDFEMGKLLRC